MDASTQTWLAAFLCLAAAAYVARRAWLAFAISKPGCGSGCGSCDGAKAKPGTLLTIRPEGELRD